MGGILSATWVIEENDGLESGYERIMGDNKVRLLWNFKGRHPVGMDNFENLELTQSVKGKF